MPAVGFRAGMAPGTGVQPCGQSPNYYTLPVNHAYEDTSGRYDATNKVWRPVAVGELPIVITLGAQVTIIGGAATVGNPSFGLKLQKNGFGLTGTDIMAGQGAADLAKPGWAFVEVECEVVANPGDFFSVSLVASCWTAGQPPLVFPSPWVPGAFASQGYGYDMCAIDPNQFHTGFWGTADMPDPAIAALAARVATLEAAGVTSAAALAALAARVTALEVP